MGLGEREGVDVFALAASMVDLSGSMMQSRRRVQVSTNVKQDSDLGAKGRHKIQAASDAER